MYSSSNYSLFLMKHTKWQACWLNKSLLLTLPFSSHALERLTLPFRKSCLSPLTASLDICQDTNQLLFKLCQGSEEAPCSKPVPVSLSEDPCCPLHLQLPPQMYVPEQVLSVPEELEAASMDLYLSAAELRPTESLPLEFSDVSEL